MSIPRFDAVRARKFDGHVYMRQEDVLQYLRNTASDWLAASSTEVTIVSAACVEGIADRLAKVTA